MSSPALGSLQRKGPPLPTLSVVAAVEAVRAVRRGCRMAQAELEKAEADFDAARERYDGALEIHRAQTDALEAEYNRLARSMDLEDGAPDFKHDPYLMRLGHAKR